MARLSLCLLGSFQPTLDGEPLIGFPSAKVRALLAYLAVEADHPCTREALAGLLWPDYPETSARISLSHTLSHLRTLLHDRASSEVRPLLLAERQATAGGQMVQFNPKADCWVDVTAFGRLAQADPAQETSAAAASEAARALYVAEGAAGRISRVDPQTGEVTTFASGLPTPIFPLGGVVDVAFIGSTAYALVTLVGTDIGGGNIVGICGVDGPDSFTVIVDIGQFSLDNPPETDFFVRPDSSTRSSPSVTGSWSPMGTITACCGLHSTVRSPS